MTRTQYEEYLKIFGGELPEGFESSHDDLLRFWHRFRTGNLDAQTELLWLAIQWGDQIPNYHRTDEKDQERNGDIVQEEEEPEPIPPKKAIQDLEANKDHVMVMLPNRGPKRALFRGMYGVDSVRVSFMKDDREYRVFKIGDIDMEPASG